MYAEAPLSVQYTRGEVAVNPVRRSKVSKRLEVN